MYIFKISQGQQHGKRIAGVRGQAGSNLESAVTVWQLGSHWKDGNRDEPVIEKRNVKGGINRMNDSLSVGDNREGGRRICGMLFCATG